MSLYDKFKEEKKTENHSSNPGDSTLAQSPKSSGGGGFVDSSKVEKEKDEKEKGRKQNFNEKEQKGIADSLAKFKHNGAGSKGTLESKMPSRFAGIEIDNHKEIKIPTSAKIHNQSLVYEKEDIEAAKKTVQEGQKAAGSIADIFKSSTIKDKKEINHQGDKNEGLFGNDGEISKKELAHEFRKDPKIWQAARQSGLFLSPTQREELAKEVFSKSYYGRNISRGDVKLAIKDLNKKILNTTDQVKHEKLRKEKIFLNKIGKMK